MGRHNSSEARRRATARRSPGRRGGRVQRRGRRSVLNPRTLVLLTVGGVVAALAVPPLVDRVVPGCQNGVGLTVAADPVVAPVVEAAADHLTATDARVQGHCVVVDVQALEPERVAAALSGSAENAGLRPDVWVPDSSVWVETARRTKAGAARLVPDNTSVARSPVVLAMPEPVATSLGWPDKPFGWKALLARVKDSEAPLSLGLADPHTSSASLAALTSMQEAAPTDGEQDEFSSSAFLVGLRRRLDAVAPDPEALLARSVSAFPALEQSVWRVNSEKPGTKLVAVYPEEGAPAADFPYAVLRAPWGDADTAAAAQLLEDAFGSARTQKARAARGLRSPDGEAGAFATAELRLAPERPERRPLPDAHTLDEALRAWDVAGRTARILAVLDVSGSMNETVPGGGGATRLELARSAAKRALSLFDGGTEMGVWRFSSRVDGEKDYEELVPTGPLGQALGGGSRADAVRDALDGLEGIHGGGTGLYDTAAAAFTAANDGYSPDLLNVVVLLTDGRNDDPGSLGRDALLRKVRDGFDPTQPVRFITIAYGADAETDVLEDLAKATEGRFYRSEDPADIRQVFLDAITDG